MSYEITQLSIRGIALIRRKLEEFILGSDDITEDVIEAETIIEAIDNWRRESDKE